MKGIPYCKFIREILLYSMLCDNCQQILLPPLLYWPNVPDSWLAHAKPFLIAAEQMTNFLRHNRQTQNIPIKRIMRPGGRGGWIVEKREST